MLLSAAIPAIAYKILLVFKACTAMLGLRPCDEFQIKLGKKQIRLVPVGGISEG